MDCPPSCPHAAIVAAAIRYAVAKTSWGWVRMEASTQGLRRIVLPSASSAQVTQLLQEEEPLPNDPLFPSVIAALRLYLSGKRIDFDFPLDLHQATPFQHRVWTAVRSIPYGEIRTYQWVGVNIGLPRGARAVGQALSHNPLPIIIPCHRVIASNGSLGGFTGGVDTKERLLSLEGLQHDLGQHKIHSAHHQSRQKGG
ncbi:MAG: methylated-DNA--[protein]-cysteine S-methyltransferase [Chloroflexi bacterium]|nr:methylated-DNA--[protein]-cysteine S-methyltransferase [Chloroflexota bacterium]